ncbi:MAG: hypothetical protein WB852_06760 [Thermoplasmata archaeon]
MESPEAGAPVVELPERVDRRIRLGPFPSARDALKFVGYAATGAVLAPFLDPFVWVPFLVVGFTVSVWRPDGEAVDERAAQWLLFQFRRWTKGSVTPRGPLTTVRGSVVRLASGRRVTIVRTEGTPLAYRPPSDLAVLFERFRELLRASEGPLVVRSTTVPLRADPVLPVDVACSDPEHAARAGYGELVSVLCRRRRSRRVEISLGSGQSGPEGERRLEERTRSLSEQLTSLGLRPVILGDRSLAESVRAFGWVLPRGSP